MPERKLTPRQVLSELADHLATECLLDLNTSNKPNLDRLRLSRAEPVEEEDIERKQNFLDTTRAIIGRTRLSQEKQQHFMGSAAFWYIAPFYDRTGLMRDLRAELELPDPDAPKPLKRAPKIPLPTAQEQ